MALCTEQRCVRDIMGHNEIENEWPWGDVFRFFWYRSLKEIHYLWLQITWPWNKGIWGNLVFRSLRTGQRCVRDIVPYTTLSTNFLLFNRKYFWHGTTLLLDVLMGKTQIITIYFNTENFKNASVFLQNGFHY